VSQITPLLNGLFSVKALRSRAIVPPTRMFVAVERADYHAPLPVIVIRIVKVDVR